MTDTTQTPTGTPTWAEVLELVTRLDGAAYADVDLQMSGLHLRMSTSPTAFTGSGPAPTPSAAPEPAPQAPTPTPTPAPATPASAAPAPPTAPDAPVPEAEAVSASAVEVIAPMLGTMYRRPSPDAAPFVTVGDTVEADTTLAIVEVMKLMNPVTAGVAGRVVEICGNEGELVEHGQVLFRVEPGGAR
jgi:acetyl-CoA carboxylase biotin carboxyl carrier protein